MAQGAGGSSIIVIPKSKMVIVTINYQPRMELLEKITSML